jgi:hypothetical protein
MLPGNLAQRSSVGDINMLPTTTTHHVCINVVFRLQCLQTPCGRQLLYCSIGAHRHADALCYCMSAESFSTLTDQRACSVQRRGASRQRLTSLDCVDKKSHQPTSRAPSLRYRPVLDSAAYCTIRSGEKALEGRTSRGIACLCPEI